MPASRHCAEQVVELVVVSVGMRTTHAHPQVRVNQLVGREEGRLDRRKERIRDEEQQRAFCGRSRKV